MGERMRFILGKCAGYFLGSWMASGGLLMAYTGIMDPWRDVQKNHRISQRVENITIRDINEDGLADVVLTDDEENNYAFFGTKEGKHFDLIGMRKELERIRAKEAERSAKAFDKSFYQKYEKCLEGKGGE